MINSVIIQGNLTRDAEWREKFGRFSIASDDGWGEKKKINFFDCVFFTENLTKYLVKGQKVIIGGKLSYYRKEDVTRISIVAEQIELIGDKKPTAERTEHKVADEEIPF